MSRKALRNPSNIVSRPVFCPDSDYVTHDLRNCFLTFVKYALCHITSASLYAMICHGFIAPYKMRNPTAAGRPARRRRYPKICQLICFQRGGTQHGRNTISAQWCVTAANVASYDPFRQNEAFVDASRSQGKHKKLLFFRRGVVETSLKAVCGQTCAGLWEQFIRQRYSLSVSYQFKLSN